MLFTNFEDLYLYTANDELAYAVEMISSSDILEVEYEEDAAKLYAVCMSFLTDTFDSKKVTRSYSEARILADSLAKLRESERLEGCECVNNIMHILHLSNPEMRRLGTAMFCEDFCGSNMGRTSLRYEGIHLTGKDSVPEQFTRQIEEAVAPWGYARTKMSWLFSHLDMGDDYMYDIDEPIDVYVYCDSPEGVELALEAVNKLHLRYR